MLDAEGTALAYVYTREHSLGSQQQYLTRDEALRIARWIARSPELALRDKAERTGT